MSEPGRRGRASQSRARSLYPRGRGRGETAARRAETGRRCAERSRGSRPQGRVRRRRRQRECRPHAHESQLPPLAHPLTTRDSRRRRRLELRRRLSAFSRSIPENTHPVGGTHAPGRLQWSQNYLLLAEQRIGARRASALPSDPHVVRAGSAAIHRRSCGCASRQITSISRRVDCESAGERARGRAERSATATRTYSSSRDRVPASCREERRRASARGRVRGTYSELSARGRVWASSDELGEVSSNGQMAQSVQMTKASPQSEFVQPESPHRRVPASPRPRSPSSEIESSRVPAADQNEQKTSPGEAVRRSALSKSGRGAPTSLCSTAARTICSVIEWRAILRGRRERSTKLCSCVVYSKNETHMLCSSRRRYGRIWAHLPPRRRPECAARAW